MLSGNLLWGEKDTSGMEMVKHRDRYCLTYPGLPQNMHAVLEVSAAKYAEKPAIIDDFWRSWTYTELLEKTNAFADALAGRFAVGKGVRVGILLYNSAEFAIAFFALCKLGAVSVPLPTKYKKQEIEALAERSGIALLIHDAEFDSVMAGIGEKFGVAGISVPFAKNVYGLDMPALIHRRGSPVRSVGLDDDCILMFTSGTTSQAKGVVLSNFNLMHSVVTYQRLLGLDENDVSIIPMPMYHITGLAALLCLFVHIGGTLYLHKKFDARRVLDASREHGVTLIHASPTIFIKMLEQKMHCPQLPALRQLACGSANMPVNHLRALKEWLPGMAFRTIYGLTETSSPASIFPGEAAGSERIGSSGMPIPGVAMKVVDENGSELANGQAGELLIRGPVVMEGYDGAAESFVGDRWFASGDLARLTDDGFVYITDRKKDMINRAGEKVWSYEVENLLHDCPGVAEAAVVGIPDDVYGEIVAALVKPLDGGGIVSPGAIVDYLTGKTARYKIPAVVRLAGEIPRTVNGKVDKNAVRRLFTKTDGAHAEQWHDRD